ncbi:hypothetical protein HMPREF0378_0786 [Eubacterium nodatum ATCC 33099]|nr:hypothetical protein HMPREF0378_0786 [Eubacterium nodatum ATCC 33099]
MISILIYRIDTGENQSIYSYSHRFFLNRLAFCILGEYDRCSLENDYNFIKN